MPRPEWKGARHGWSDSDRTEHGSVRVIPVVPMLPDTATERVRERIRAEILAGDYPPGERLKIADIAERYGISSIPVREALRLLAGEGLVELAPHRGAIVRPVDPAFVVNSYDIRMALEAMLVDRAIERMGAADLDRIRAGRDAYASAAALLDASAMLDADAAFHGAIRDAAANEEATLVLRRGNELIRAMRISHGFTRERAAENVAQHASLTEAIEARDARRAKRTVREHCISGRDDLLALMRRRAGEAEPRRAS